MTQPKRFSVKYFVEGGATSSGVNFDLAVLTPIFQRWIQEHTVEGLLIDVADYRHVLNGPGVLLIGHEADYSFDLKGGQPGVLYTRKRELQGNLSEDLATALRLLTDAAHKLEAEPLLNGLRLNYGEVVVAFLDRLETPNTPEIFDGLSDELHAAAASLFASDSVQVESIEADPRKVLTVRLATAREQVTS